MDKLITVVIPTYKRPLLLLNCIKSLLLQTCDKNYFEVIIISDGPDYSIQLLAESFNKDGFSFKYNCLKVKAGPAAARNLGWQMATTDLIAFTDDDCLPDKDWLTNLIKQYHQEEYFVSSGKLIVPISTIPTDYEKNISNLETASFITANCCCTKKALEKVGGFDERFSLAWREDSDLEFKLMLSNISIIKNEHAVVVHPVRTATFGISIKEQKKGIYNALLYKKYPSLYRKFIQPKPAWNYYAMFALLLLIIAGLIMGSTAIVFYSAVAYLILLFNFISKRLKNASRKFSHVIEMIYTSTVIPILSIYWQLYGAVKYKVLFF